VEGDSPRVARFHLGSNLTQGFLAPADDGHRDSLIGEPQRDSPAQATGCSGHRDATVVTHGCHFATVPPRESPKRADLPRCARSSRSGILARTRAGTGSVHGFAATEMMTSLAHLPEGAERGTVMADKKNIHTVPTEDGWANRREGAKRASSTHDTKAEAQAAGRAAAKKEGVEHLIHKKEGTIGDRNSYGNDPHPPNG
jgi:hypothetical protein